MTFYGTYLDAMREFERMCSAYESGLVSMQTLKNYLEEEDEGYGELFSWDEEEDSGMVLGSGVGDGVKCGGGSGDSGVVI